MNAAQFHSDPGSLRPAADQSPRRAPLQTGTAATAHIVDPGAAMGGCRSGPALIDYRRETSSVRKSDAYLEEGDLAARAPLAGRSPRVQQGDCIKSYQSGVKAADLAALPSALRMASGLLKGLAKRHSCASNGDSQGLVKAIN
jgi:hypothetical protein